MLAIALTIGSIVFVSSLIVFSHISNKRENNVKTETMNVLPLTGSKAAANKPYPAKRKEPLYFLYTRTLLNDYEYKNVFYDANKTKKIIDEARGKFLYNNGRVFLQEEFGTERVIVCEIRDGRRDNYAREIYSYFGVVIDKNDDSFDVDGFKNKLVKHIGEIHENNTDCFDIANEFPVIWDNNRDLPDKTIGNISKKR